MDDRASVDQLVRLGLTTYEARAYIALVRRDSYTAAQIARGLEYDAAYELRIGSPAPASRLPQTA